MNHFYIKAEKNASKTAFCIVYIAQRTNQSLFNATFVCVPINLLELPHKTLF